MYAYDISSQLRIGKEATNLSTGPMSVPVMDRAVQKGFGAAMSNGVVRVLGNTDIRKQVAVGKRAATSRAVVSHVK